MKNKILSGILALSVISSLSAGAFANEAETIDDFGAENEVMLLSNEITEFNVKEIRVGGMNHPTTAQGASALTNIPLNAPIEVRFNHAVADESVTEDNIYITSGGSRITARVEKDRSDTVYIYPKGQEMSTEYIINIASGIMAKENTAVTTASAKTYKYTTTSDEMAFKGFIANTDFDNYEGQSTESGNGIIDGRFKYVTANGLTQKTTDTMSVVVDNYTGSPALELKRAAGSGTGSGTRYIYELPDSITNGKLVVTYDLRFASVPVGVDSLMSFGSSADAGSINTNWTNKVSSATTWHYYDFNGNNNSNWGNKNQLTGSIPAMMSLDLSIKTISGEIFRSYDTNPGYEQRSKTWKADIADVKYLNFVEFSGTSADTDQIYYIDNLKIAYYNYPAIEVLKEPDIEFDANEAITVKFTQKVDSTSFDKIKLYKGKGENKEEVSDIAVAIDTEDNTGRTVKISKTGGFEYDCDYTLEVLAGFKAEKEKIYPLIESYIKEIKTKSIIGTTNITKEGQKFNGRFALMHTGLDGYTYTYEIKTEGSNEYISYNGTDEITEQKKHTLKITAKKTGDTSEKCEVKEYAFEVIGEEAPSAENVVISGTMQMGETLEITYDYIDENDDPDNLKEDTSKTVYSWKVSDKENGEFKEIASTKTITVDERFEDKYIKVSVIPVSLEEPYKENLAYESKVYMGIFRPVVTKAEITQEANLLTATYAAEDKNEEDIVTAEYQWYSSTQKDTGYEPITDAKGATYEIKDTEYNKYILVGIKAISNNKPLESSELRSAYIIAPFAPVITATNITGTPKAGQTIGAEYTLYDENGDKDDGSIITWYVNGVAKNTGRALELTKSMVGDKIYFEVQPCVSAEPKIGEIVKSKVVTVANSSSSGGGFGGGSGGSGGSGSVSPTIPTPEKPGQDKPITSETNIIFKDMEEHWARKEVEKLYEKGIVNGVTDNEFYPDKTITRAEVAAIFSRALKLDAADADFADVDKDSWYYDAVAKVQNAGLFVGSNGFFRPNDKITRQEFACVIARIIEKYEIVFEEKETEFVDDDAIADWAKVSVLKAFSAGIINGMSDGRFAPSENTTRAQAAVMISRLLDLMEVNVDE